MSAATAHVRPRTMWVTLPGCLFQLFGIFVLPFVIAVPAALIFDMTEVIETLPALLMLATVALAPVTALQVLGILLKSREEGRYWRSVRGLTVARRFDVWFRHTSVVTSRGWVLLIGALLMTVLALAVKWASLGIIAVLALLSFYIVLAWTLFVSTFLARTFQAGMGQGAAGIERQMVPAVVQTGDPVEEVVRLKKVPVPWGYVLVVEDRNPPRLRTETRVAVGASARSGEIEVRGALRATPRGLYLLGPAQIAYQDLLGITRVSVASVATCELKVLPRILPVVVVDPPRSTVQMPDVVTRPHRWPTEDLFRFRDYAAGDDTRRIHWRLSMRAGRLHIRLPESKETSTERIVLVIDSYLPPGKLMNAAHGGEEILDAVVLAWLGIGKELVSRGNRVTLLAAATAADGEAITLQQIDAGAGSVARWQDLGARVRWQSAHDLPAMLASVGDRMHGVVVTARFTAPPPLPFQGQTLTWLLLDPADALGAPDPHWIRQLAGKGPLSWLRWMTLLPSPVGSDDNAFLRRVAAANVLRRTYTARATLRTLARRRAGGTRKALEARGDAIYRIERTATAVRLVGIRGRSAG